MHQAPARKNCKNLKKEAFTKPNYPYEKVHLYKALLL